MGNEIIYAAAFVMAFLVFWVVFNTIKLYGGWIELLKRRRSDWPILAALVATIFVPITVLTLAEFVEVLLWEPKNLEDKSAAIRNIGLLLAAIFGLPFVIWRSIVAQKQVDVSEQSQITDRINKAVEGLGAEKTVKEVHETPRYRKKNGEWLYDENNELIPALRPDGEPLVDREVVERSVPNIEVRIGAIYALERIAQDSNRDHVQILEILCAYIRENAPASEAEPRPKLETRYEEKSGPMRIDWGQRWKRFYDEQLKLIETLQPREDIQIALVVIGRRSNEQRNLEAKVHNQSEHVPFVFDSAGPDPRRYFKNKPSKANAEKFKLDLKAWLYDLSEYECFRLDLSNTNLRGADLNGLNLAGAKLNNVLLQGATLEGTHMQGTIFFRAQLDGTNLCFASLQGASFKETSMLGARFDNSNLQGAEFRSAKMQCSNLRDILCQGATFFESQMQNTQIVSAQLQGASFKRAALQKSQLDGSHLQNANLRSANLHDADFGRTRMQMTNLTGINISKGTLWKSKLQGANLEHANLQGTDLHEAEMEDTNLNRVKMDENTGLTDVVLSGACIRLINKVTIKKLQNHLVDSFGDATVLPPGAEHRPRHWPIYELRQYSPSPRQNNDRFYEEWRKWQELGDAYEPPTEVDEANGVFPYVEDTDD